MPKSARIKNRYLGQGICVAENGNLFVIAGEEGETSKIYRLDAETGVAEEVVSNIEPLCNIAYYFNSKNIMKMSGVYVGGLCADGRLYKANTNTGEVEYITPRFPVGKLVTAASNKAISMR